MRAARCGTVQLFLETIGGFPSQMFVLVLQGGFLDFLPVMENSRKAQKAKYLCGDECVCVLLLGWSESTCCVFGPEPTVPQLETNPRRRCAHFGNEARPVLTLREENWQRTGRRETRASWLAG